MGRLSELRTPRYRLYAVPRPLFGVARLLDLFGYFDSYNYSGSPGQADNRSLRADWSDVGRDLWAAVGCAEPPHTPGPARQPDQD